MDKNLYLQPSEIIDWKNPLVLNKARELASGSADETATAKKCFEFVRDEILHSYDYKMNPVTCKASDVLIHKTGFCFAKSHLLAALLRANSIPAGFCYQRIRTEYSKKPFLLHGLNGVFLKEFGWYRIDARGNNEKINARFDPPRETLAFKTISDGEADFPEIWYEPLPAAVKVLSEYKNYQDAVKNLPDIEIIKV